MNNGLILKMFVMVLIALSLVHCGKSGGSSTPSATCDSSQQATAVGCLPTCGPNMVMYNNSCVSASGLSSGVMVGSNGNFTGIYGSGGIGSNGSMCSGTCGPGAVLMTDGRTCLPQGSCDPCYGYAAGYCYIGAYAHAYYGK